MIRRLLAAVRYAVTGDVPLKGKRAVLRDLQAQALDARRRSRDLRRHRVGHMLRQGLTVREIHEDTGIPMGTLYEDRRALRRGTAIR